MKRFIVTLSLLITVFLINFDSKATIITAVSSGNWDSPFTWTPNVPECGDTVIIPFGVSVTVTVNVDLDSGDPLCPLFRMTVLGNLRFAAGKKMNLASGACVSVEAGGSVAASSKGGGASEAVYIGPDRVWQASGGTLNGIAALGCAILLPVDLINFTVSESREKFVLSWVVDNENNLSHYLIWYSKNGMDWTWLGEIEKKSTSHIYNDKNYEFITPVFGDAVYFKLSSVDNNGNQVALRIIRVELNLEINEELTIAPNPSKISELISVAYKTIEDTETTFNIVDQRGQVIYTMSKLESSKDGLVIFDTSLLKSGTYFVNINNRNQSLKSKLAVL